MPETPQTPPSIRNAATLSVAALLDFAVVVFMSAEVSRATPRLYAMTALELGLIALAMAGWVQYFRAYVAFAISSGGTGN